MTIKEEVQFFHYKQMPADECKNGAHIAYCEWDVAVKDNALVSFDRGQFADPLRMRIIRQVVRRRLIEALSSPSAYIREWGKLVQHETETMELRLRKETKEWKKLPAVADFLRTQKGN